MKNKMLIIIGSIIVLFGALYFVVDAKNKQTIGESDNPYGTTKLKQSTIDILDDPLYQNQIIPGDLKDEIEGGSETTVYFFSPECEYCKITTPVLVPLTEELDIDMKKLNLLEFGNEMNAYNITGTPTVVHYEDGEEVARINGARSEEEFRVFLNEYVVN